MRMWMVDPRIMCRQHLLGEHNEIHMFVGAINRGQRLGGYISNNLLDMSKLHERHEALALEMTTRGFTHNSKLPDFDTSKYPEHQRRTPINSQKSLADLLARCNKCAEAKTKERELPF